MKSISYLNDNGNYLFDCRFERTIKQIYTNIQYLQSGIMIIINYEYILEYHFIFLLINYSL